jgi:hypothetical protein
MSDLDKRFNANYPGGAKEAGEAQNNTSGADEMQRKSEEVLEQTVLPVLHELSAAIQQQGHQAKVSVDPQKLSYPYVDFEFTPSGGKDKFSSIPTATLRFAHSKTGHIEVRADSSAKDGNTHYGNSTGTGAWVLSEVTEDKVRSSVVSFVESVLKVTYRETK